MDKLFNLRQILEKMGSAAVAFSGGTDSTLLLAAALEVLGRQKVLAITAVSCFVPEREIISAKGTAEEMAAEHICINVDILREKDAAFNSRLRCYACKKIMFSRICGIAEDRGLGSLLHGANADDLSQIRPGMKAAEELGFIAPLAEAQLTKAEIRKAAFSMGIRTWNKPSQSCLATRMPRDEKINPMHLEMVDRAEIYLQSLGFLQVRVRFNQNHARIEVAPEKVQKLVQLDRNRKISGHLEEIGFRSVTIDQNGYQSGKET